MQERRTQESRFFDTVFSDILEEHNDLRILVWHPGRVGSHFFDAPGEAGKYAFQKKAKFDLYFSLGLRHKKIDQFNQREKKSKRGTEAEVEGIAGFAIDLDLQGPSRGKTNLFESYDEARSLISRLEHQPTLIVSTGNGFHVYWLFHEPWIFESAEDREAAKRMSFGWHHEVKGKTERTIDSKYPLDGVWRIPGTHNHKEGVDCMVEVVEHNDFNRYDPDDAFSFYSKSKVGIAGKSDEKVIIEVSSSATIPEKCLNSLAVDPNFAKTWHHLRRYKSGDDSQSSHDLAIANFGALAGWTNQEIVDACIANRRVYSDDLKLRQDYWVRTLQRVRGEDVDIEETGETEESGLISTFSSVVGMPIDSLYMIGSKEHVSDVTYYVALKSGQRLKIGSVRDFRQRANWIDLHSIHFPSMTVRGIEAKAWKKLVTRIFPLVKDRTSIEDAPRVKFATQIEAYMTATSGLNTDEKTWNDMASILDTNTPFRRSKKVWVHRDHFRRWLLSHRLPASKEDIQSHMEALGFLPATVSYQIRDKNTSRRYWHLDEDILRRIVDNLGEEDGQETEKDEHSD